MTMSRFAELLVKILWASRLNASFVDKVKGCIDDIHCQKILHQSTQHLEP